MGYITSCPVSFFLTCSFHCRPSRRLRRSSSAAARSSTAAASTPGPLSTATPPPGRLATPARPVLVRRRRLRFDAGASSASRRHLGPALPGRLDRYTPSNPFFHPEPSPQTPTPRTPPVAAMADPYQPFSSTFCLCRTRSGPSERTVMSPRGGVNRRTYKFSLKCSGLNSLSAKPGTSGFQIRNFRIWARQ